VRAYKLIREHRSIEAALASPEFARLAKSAVFAKTIAAQVTRALLHMPSWVSASHAGMHGTTCLHAYALSR
jgi:hypothetical protein